MQGRSFGVMEMLMKLGIVLRLLLLLIVDPGGEAVLMEDEEPLSCLEGRSRCLQDATCRVLLETVNKVCGLSIYTCQTSNRFHCYSVLASLQTNAFFQNCICHSTDLDSKECDDIQKKIFLHACVNHQGSSPNVSWIIPSPDSDHSTDEEDEDEDTEPEERDVSCIGIRKNCLRKTRCNQMLTEFRNFCRENKKLDQCIATDWQMCQRAIEELRSETADLFSCQCTMKRPLIREKCNRIRWRISGNTCLVTVPYLIYSAKLPEPSFQQLSLMLDSRESIIFNEQNSTCPGAFARCLTDDRCQSGMERVLDRCSWNHTAGGCALSRDECLSEIGQFYESIRPDLGMSLVLCRCRPDDDLCLTFRNSLRPTCAAVELPPPSCSDLLQRCIEDDDCRSRWLDYERFCGYDKNVGGCPSNALCRTAQLNIMGSMLMTNCTCVADNEQQVRCNDARQRLQQHNICKDMSVHDYHSHLATISFLRISTMTPTVTRPTVSRDQRHHQTPTIISSIVHHLDCKRLRENRVDSEFPFTDLYRIYDSRDKICSSLCRCRADGSTTCVSLPCPPSQPCTGREAVYADGSSFALRERGNCSCLKGEFVCAKSQFGMDQKEGLFLHVGYSVAERIVIEDNSDIKFKSVTMTRKLSYLLNQDSTEKLCSLSQYGVYDGNVVYEIRSTSLASSLAVVSESCVVPAKNLMHTINSADPILTRDAELSILKVAQLERVQFHVQSVTKPRKSSSSLMRNGGSSGRHSSLMYLIRNDVLNRLILTSTLTVFSISVSLNFFVCGGNAEVSNCTI